MQTNELNIEDLVARAGRLQRQIQNAPLYAKAFGSGWSSKDDAEARAELAAVEKELRAAERASLPFWLRWLP